MEDIQTEKLDQIFKIANNILVFDDSSDYGGALFEILKVIKPEIEFDDLELID